MLIYNSLSGCRNDIAPCGGRDTHSSASGIQTQEHYLGCIQGIHFYLLILAILPLTQIFVAWWIIWYREAGHLLGRPHELGKRAPDLSSEDMCAWPAGQCTYYILPPWNWNVSAPLSGFCAQLMKCVWIVLGLQNYSSFFVSFQVRFVHSF
jgi:hypothetical protein